jgi:iron(III) transport system substrate-binding protein
LVLQIGQVHGGGSNRAGKNRRCMRSDIAVSKQTSMPDLATLKVFALNLQVANDEYAQLIALWNLALAKAKR